MKKYVASCEICQKVKAKFTSTSSPLHLSEQSKIPFDTIHLDYAELKKKSEVNRSTRSFLVMVDEATRTVDAVPAKENTESVITAVENHPKFSKAKTIITDCGTCFTSKKLTSFLSALPASILPMSGGFSVM